MRTGPGVYGYIRRLQDLQAFRLSMIRMGVCTILSHVVPDTLQATDKPINIRDKQQGGLYSKSRAGPSKVDGNHRSGCKMITVALLRSCRVIT